MAYQHGVYTNEIETSIQPPVSVASALPFIVGTAPINMTDPTNVNKVVKCSNYAEFVAAFGFVPAEDAGSDLKKYAYTLSEFAYSQFRLFGVGPVYAVNVLDPTKHKKKATTASVTLDASSGSATVPETGILTSSVVLTPTSASAYKEGTDYLLTFDDKGYLVITSLMSGSDFKCEVGKSLTFTADKLDPSMVTEEDIIGGVSVDGAKSGFELVNECFPKFREAPTILLAPGFSESPTVAAILAAKCPSINGLFKAVALVDVPTDEVTNRTLVADWKNRNNIVDPTQVVCWPMLSLDSVVYHMSTQMAGLMGQVDSDHNGVPYVSPSNKNLQMTASILVDGTEVALGPDEGAELNGQGITTVINFIGGWAAWGNRTACYPSNTDVKDAFISIRRMFGWVENTLTQTHWSKIDDPTNRRLIDIVVDSANMWLNGLVSKGYLLGGLVEFRQEDNITTDLMDGILRFHVSLTPPSPARAIHFTLEYKVDYLQNLFS